MSRTLLGTLLCVKRLFAKTQVQSKHYRRGKFHNTPEKETGCHVSGILKFLRTEKWGTWPAWVENTATPSLQKADETVITFINHASFLIEVGNLKVLIDPVFSTRAGPLGWFGPKRRRAPGLAFEDLPAIDVVLITHNHYDHLDFRTLKALQKRFSPKIIVPVGDKAWLTQLGINNIEEMDWWQSLALGEGAQVHFVPAQHFSGRGLFDRDKSFWGGYVLEHPNLSLFHAGDTGYGHHFKEVGQRFKIDVALLPIGAYKPSWFLSYVHMNPGEAVQAHQDLGARQSYAMHYKTFCLSALNYLEAEEDLSKALEGKGGVSFHTLEVGESVRG